MLARKMRVVQVSIGRFHHFDLAKQLAKRGLLTRFYTGYPSYKLKNYSLPIDKIITFPWLMAPRMAVAKNSLFPERIEDVLHRWAQETLDYYVATHLPECDVLIALSGSGLRAGHIAQKRGGYFICDRGSSHIRYQDSIMREEYRRWGRKFHGIDEKVIEKEEKEYEAADIITVPSNFVRSTFINAEVKTVLLKQRHTQRNKNYQTEIS